MQLGRARRCRAYECDVTKGLRRSAFGNEHGSISPDRVWLVLSALVIVTMGWLLIEMVRLWL